MAEKSSSSESMLMDTPTATAAPATAEPTAASPPLRPMTRRVGRTKEEMAVLRAKRRFHGKIEPEANVAALVAEHPTLIADAKRWYEYYEGDLTRVAQTLHVPRVVVEGILKAGGQSEFQEIELRRGKNAQLAREYRQLASKLQDRARQLIPGADKLRDVMFGLGVATQRALELDGELKGPATAIQVNVSMVREVIGLQRAVHEELARRGLKRAVIVKEADHASGE